MGQEGNVKQSLTLNILIVFIFCWYVTFREMILQSLHISSGNFG